MNLDVLQTLQELFKGRRVTMNDFPGFDLLIPGQLVFFHDRKSMLMIDETGFNQIGVLSEDKNIIFCRNGKMLDIPFKKLGYVTGITTGSIFHIEEDILRNNALKYFKKNKYNPYLFLLGLRKLHNINNDPCFFDSDILMPKLKPLTSTEHEKAWQRVTSKLQPADLIFTFTRNSIISTCIAKIDNGCWSHTGVYLGDGYISEMIASGAVKRKLDVYRNHKIHIGIYRRRNIDDTSRKDIVMFAMNISHRARYAWKTAFKLGVAKLFNIPTTINTPNDLIYGGEFRLIDYL